MKTKIAWFSMISAAALALCGCGQKEESAAVPAGQAAPTAPATVDRSANPPDNPSAPPAVLAPAAPAAPPATDAMAVRMPPAAPAEVTAPPVLAEPVDPVKQAQAIIDNVKGFADRKQYTFALANLRGLVVSALTPEQRKAVDEIKANIEKAMGKEAYEAAVKAMGGFPQSGE